MLLSVDLKKRVVESIDQGMRVTDAAKTFKVSIRSIYYWIKRKKEKNSLFPKSGYQKGHSHKITDWDAFKEFVEQHKMFTVKQMVLEWEKLFNEKISKSTMGRALKKCNYTSKKKLLDIPNQTKISVKYFWKKLKI